MFPCVYLIQFPEGRHVVSILRSLCVPMALKLPATMLSGACDSWAMRRQAVSGTKMDMASSGSRHAQCLGPRAVWDEKHAKLYGAGMN